MVRSSARDPAQRWRAPCSPRQRADAPRGHHVGPNVCGHVRIAVSLALAVLLASAARGQEEAPVEPPIDSAAPASRGWYGWQILIIDAASIGLLARGLSGKGDSTAAIAGGVGFALGPVVIHALHKNSGGLARDLVFRVLIPAAGIGAVWLAISLEQCNLAQCLEHAIEGAVLIVVSAITAMVLDYRSSFEPASRARFAVVAGPTRSGASAVFSYRF
jgi:hypothetical protein